jgi:hypothetical protein
MICRKAFDADGLVADVVSATHRLGYLVSRKKIWRQSNDF